MTYSGPARATPRRAPRTLVVGLLVVIAATVAVLGYQLLTPSRWTAASPIDVQSDAYRGAPLKADSALPNAYSLVLPSVTAASPIDVPRSERRGVLGEADGRVPNHTTVFDDEVPGVANLDPDLLEALRHAAIDAADDRVEFQVNSGWRSPQYQDQLLREAVSEYGSEEEAARWVATPNTSAHVSGDAVDIGPPAAAEWLSEQGARYGLCQIYDNEPWHYELRREAIEHGCPAMYADPTHDPRMQR